MKITAGTAPMLVYEEIVDLPQEDIYAFAAKLKRITNWNDLIGQRIIAILYPIIVFENAFVEFSGLGYISTGDSRKFGRSHRFRMRNALGQRITSLSYRRRDDAEVLHLANGQEVAAGPDEDYFTTVGIVIRHTRSGYESVYPFRGE